MTAPPGLPQGAKRRLSVLFAPRARRATDGNLYAPVSDGRAAARGGWRRRPDPPPQLRRLAAAGLLAAGSLTIARIVTRSSRT